MLMKAKARTPHGRAIDFRYLPIGHVHERHFARRITQDDVLR